MIDFFAMDASNGPPIQHRGHPTAQARIAAVLLTMVMSSDSTAEVTKPILSTTSLKLFDNTFSRLLSSRQAEQ